MYKTNLHFEQLTSSSSSSPSWVYNAFEESVRACLFMNSFAIFKPIFCNFGERNYDLLSETREEERRMIFDGHDRMVLQFYSIYYC